MILSHHQSSSLSLPSLKIEELYNDTKEQPGEPKVSGHKEKIEKGNRDNTIPLESELYIE